MLGGAGPGAPPCAKAELPLNRTRLAAERDRIYQAVMTSGWNAERQTFVQHFGTDAVDASNLIMPLVLFLSPTDPRMRGTLDRTMAELVSDSLVHRYEIGKGAGDGLTGSEGTFNMCTFWLVEALARAGRVEEARYDFRKDADLQGTTSVCTPRRRGRSARRWATSLRPSPTLG